MRGWRSFGVALVVAAFVFVGGVAEAHSAQQPPVVPSLDPASTATLWKRLVYGPRVRTSAASLDCRRHSDTSAWLALPRR